jgi:DNA-binding IclR family transcriptional regulator
MNPVPRSGHDAPVIRPVDHVCDILDLLRDGSKGISLGQVAEVTELPRDAVLGYLAVLEARRYVERDEQGHYRPGPALQCLSR